MSNPTPSIQNPAPTATVAVDAAPPPAGESKPKKYRFKHKNNTQAKQGQQPFGSEAATPRPARPRSQTPRPAKPDAPAPRRPAAPPHPALIQLAELYPKLFGHRLLPLKRGVLEELEQLHGDLIAKADLKLALTQHTRSSRYLATLASGQARHDLTGQAVEPVSPEHRYHALTELYRRRQQRHPQDLSAELRQRIIEAAEASGLTPASYARLVRHKNEAANVQLDQAVTEWNDRIARDEARLRAFESSGNTVKQFAEMYGLNPIETAATLNRARHHRQVASTDPLTSA